MPSIAAPRSLPGARSEATTAAAASTASATHKSGRTPGMSSTIRCHWETPRHASAAKPTSLATQTGSSADGVRSSGRRAFAEAAALTTGMFARGLRRS